MGFDLMPDRQSTGFEIDVHVLTNVSYCPSLFSLSRNEIQS